MEFEATMWDYLSIFGLVEETYPRTAEGSAKVYVPLDDVQASGRTFVDCIHLFWVPLKCWCKAMDS